MSRFKAKVIPLGTHKTKKGPFHATPERLSRLRETFQRMKTDGRKVPAAWGHQPNAHPGTLAQQKADKEYWNSKYNAGYVDEVLIEADGTLSAWLDCPGVETDENGRGIHTAVLPDGREVKCAIDEVSAAIKQFDAQDKNYGEAMVHVALTPWPVVPGQKGFEKMPAGSFTNIPSADPAEGEFHLSLATLELAADPNNADEEGKPPVGQKKSPDDGDKVPKKPDETPPPSPADEKKANEEAEFQELLQLLAAVVNVHLPEGTTKENMVERLKTILNHESKSGPNATPDGKTPEGTPPAATPPGTESPPMFMSLSDCKDPASKASFLREQKSKRAALKGRISSLARRRWPGTEQPCLKADLVKELTDAADGYELSLTEEGDAVEKDLDKRLADLERVLPSLTATTWKDGATELSNPADLVDEKPDPEYVEQQIAAAGLTSYRGAAKTNGAARR